jgi:hypothetical protein
MTSSDRWMDIYLVILGVYGGGAELHHWAKGSEPPPGWAEHVRRGGPLITLWVILLFAAGAWRLADPARPMPPELKDITLGVIGVFFGTYTLRQLRRSPAGARIRSRLAGTLSPEGAVTGNSESAVIDFLKTHGPSSPASISDALLMPRRTLTRVLAQLVARGTVIKEGASANDPSSQYRLL